MAVWWSLTGAFLLVGIILFAYFHKINWVKDMRLEGNAKKVFANHLESKKRRLGKLPPVYPNGWFALLESSQLKKCQVKHVTALGENFAVFRTVKGCISILDAYCPHLGANMAEGGRVIGDCLECPFHGWQFRGDNGHCESIPYAGKVPHIAKTKIWASCEVNGIIFVWYHAEGLEPNWQLQPHALVSNRTWRFQGRNEFLINCHIQDVVENGADLAHLSAVHGPAIFLGGTLSWLSRHSWTNVSWTPHTSFLQSENCKDVETSKNINGIRHDVENFKHRAKMTLNHSLVILERYKILQLELRIHQIGPGYVELLIDTSIGPMCIFQTVTPMEPLLQKVIHVIYSPPLIGPYASVVFLGECLMFQRDVAIWNRKKYEKQPLLVKEDKNILAFRRWYSQFYSSKSPTYNSAVKSVLW